MFPAAFDQDGLLFANTRFGDFPHYLPTKKWQNKDELFTGWMLLSYRKPVAASSVRGVYAAANVTDENPRSFWVANSNPPGEWLTLDLGGPCEVRAVQVNFTDFKVRPLRERCLRLYSVQVASFARRHQLAGAG